MFNLKDKFGDHCIYSFPPKEFDFLEYFQNLFNTSDLEQIHLLSQDYKNVADKDGVDKDFSNMDVDLHKKFYNDNS